jgi:RNA polymerase sigma-70 factor, ECF subfamily
MENAIESPKEQVKENTPSVDLHKGEVSAFNDLHTRYAGRVLAYLLSQGRSRSEAEDLTQETFIAAYLHHKTYQATASPLAWLFGIARRRTRDAQRQKMPATEPISEATEGLFAPHADPAERVPDQICLLAALEKIPASERDAFLLVFVQRLTYQEAAHVLEEPVGTVKWRVHEATKRLRGILTGDEKENSV